MHGGELQKAACEDVSAKALKCGIDAAAVSAGGGEGGTISGGTSGAASTASGCFPSFWDPQDFDQWLNGDFTGALLPAAMAMAM